MKHLNLSKALPSRTTGLLITLLFFVFGAQRLLGQDTLFSSVSITTVDSAADANSAHWDVKFKVDTTGTNGNADGGWIIQKITMSRVIYPCPKKEGNKPDPRSPKPIEYYEVWPVAPGSDTTTSELPNGADDHFFCDLSSTYAPDNTYGTFTVKCEMAFVNDPGTAPDGSLPNTPGDPGGADTNRTDAGGSTWAPGGVPQAGGLVSTTTKPSFWDELLSSGKVTSRTWVVTWDKCKDDSDVEDPVEEEETPIDEDAEEGRGRGPQTTSTFLTDEQLLFFPNPAKNVIRVSGAEAIQTQIYSISGQVLIESNDREIHVGELSPGIYIIHLSSALSVHKEFLIIE